MICFDALKYFDKILETIHSLCIIIQFFSIFLALEYPSNLKIRRDEFANRNSGTLISDFLTTRKSDIFKYS